MRRFGRIPNSIYKFEADLRPRAGAKRELQAWHGASDGSDSRTSELIRADYTFGGVPRDGGMSRMSETNNAESSVLERRGELISRIGDSIVGPWTALTYSARMLSMYAEDGVQVQRPDGTTESAFGPPRVIRLLKELRKVMYQPDGGTRLSAEWRITDDGERHAARARFNYDVEPHWDSDVDPDCTAWTLVSYMPASRTPFRSEARPACPASAAGSRCDILNSQPPCRLYVTGR